MVVVAHRKELGRRHHTLRDQQSADGRPRTYRRPRARERVVSGAAARFRQARVEGPRGDPRLGRDRIGRLLPHAESAHEVAPPPALLAETGHVHHDGGHSVLRHAEAPLDGGGRGPCPRPMVALAEGVKERSVREVAHEPRGRERDAGRGRRRVAGHSQRRLARALPAVGVAEMDQGRMDRSGVLAPGAQLPPRLPDRPALVELAVPARVTHVPLRLRDALTPRGRRTARTAAAEARARREALLEACLHELDAARERDGPRDARRHDVVQVGLLVGVAKVGRPRPRRVWQVSHALRVVREAMDAPIELLEHPRGRVALAHVLHVEDPRVDEGVVRLHHELVLRVERLQDRVRVGEPDGVAVEVEHVEVVDEHEPLEQHLARLEEGERLPLEHIVVQRAWPRPSKDARPPDAHDTRQHKPQLLARLPPGRHGEHVVQAHLLEGEDRVGCHPHRPVVAHAQQHHLAVRRGRRQHAREGARVVEVAASVQRRCRRLVLAVRGAVRLAGERRARPGKIGKRGRRHSFGSQIGMYENLR